MKSLSMAVTRGGDQVFLLPLLDLVCSTWQDLFAWSSAARPITSRGDGRDDIFVADGDRRVFIEGLAEVWERFNSTVHAYCLMSNHYHLLVETRLDGAASES